MCEESAMGGVLRSADSDRFDLSSAFEDTCEVAQSRSTCSSPEAVFSSQRNSLVRTLSLYCGDPGLAEDCVQEAFARLCINWRRVSTYDWIGCISPGTVRPSTVSIVWPSAWAASRDRRPP